MRRFVDGYAPGGKTGVLLVNLGTPARPSASAVRGYLSEFLSDPRVVELPRWLWQIVLNGFILPLRAGKSARAYRRIWMQEGSPLLVLSRSLTAKVRQRLGENYEVVLGMRYGRPSIPEALEALRQARVGRLLVLPLYPQYAAATTGSTFDAVARVLQNWRYVPSLSLVSDYHDHPAYLRALAEGIRRAREGDDAPYLLFSFHGLPERSRTLGDPYADQCRRTAEGVAERLGLPATRWGLAYQSRFGRAEWLKPYCVDALRELAARGVTAVDVVCPGFAVDCLETLDEIARENRRIFLDAGGERFRYLPCLNDTDAHAELLAGLLAGERFPVPPVQKYSV
ncbi:MAG TPA: ferrochelatase [Methylococcaceae bacterium]|nr:ferrochelatase [Methylococcaceae bacterium]